MFQLAINNRSIEVYDNVYDLTKYNVRQMTYLPTYSLHVYIGSRYLPRFSPRLILGPPGRQKYLGYLPTYLIGKYFFLIIIICRLNRYLPT